MKFFKFWCPDTFVVSALFSVPVFAQTTILLVTLFLLSPFVAVAEIKTFTKEYTYQASELDSKSSSRLLALEQAKRLLLEELGVYLTSHTEVVDSKLTKDKIISITAGIVSATVLSEKWDGKEFWLKAQISADPTIVNDAIKAIVRDTKKTDELEASNKKIDKLTKQLDEIKGNLGETEKVKQSKYNQVIDKISAEDMMREYKTIYSDGDTKVADEDLIQRLTKIIAKDKNLGDAYWYRAIIYMKQKNYVKAEVDFFRQIEIGYYKSYALSKLTHIYYDKKEFSKYIDFMYQVIENSDRSNLMFDYFSKPLTDKDYSTFLKKYPNNYMLYAVKARTELMKRPRDKKSKDSFVKLCNKSISLNSKQFVAYYLLAEFYKDYSYTVSEEEFPDVVKLIIKYSSLGLTNKTNEIVTKELVFLRAAFGSGIRNCDDTANDYIWLTKLKPDLSDYYAKVGLFKNYCGRYNEAVFFYKKAIEVANRTNLRDLGGLYENFGDMHAFNNQAKLATEAYNQAIIALDDDIQYFQSTSEDKGSFQSTIDGIKQTQAEIRDKMSEMSY